MAEPTEDLPPDWAIEKAIKEAGSACSVRDVMAGTIIRYLQRSILAHARTIAKYEKPPVDPDVRLVADVVNAFNGIACVKDDTVMNEAWASNLARAVAVYRERKPGGRS